MQAHSEVTKAWISQVEEYAERNRNIVLTVLIGLPYAILLIGLEIIWSRDKKHNDHMRNCEGDDLRFYFFGFGIGGA
jgi:hypothetical protein